MKKRVIVSALDATYQRKEFGRIMELVPLSESVVKLTAVCHICNESASFTFRKCAGDEVVDIGGHDKYIPLCRECYLLLTNAKAS